MARLNIYIPDRELKDIEAYCSKRSLHKSVFLWKSAIHVINQVEKKNTPIVCDFCRSPSVGRFKMFVYDTDSGGVEKVVNLCKLHLGQAQREGEVVKHDL